ncbi:TonB family protein [Anianabacter salinae]|uniref:TonB family protein n=1 Tax=Anianabacter salinae TaxID=2851023 RepID=UPI00225E134A|nr:TonB family protein [Anianabacter salinae]MBV0912473.1 TonB family protein [Anianabacter salinae]
MIASSRLMATAAVLAAVAVHALALGATRSAEAPEIEGRSGGADVALGSGFADLVAGATPSAQVSGRVAPERPVETTAQEAAAPADRPEITMTDAPGAAPVQPPVQPERAAPVPQQARAPTSAPSATDAVVPDPAALAALSPTASAAPPAAETPPVHPSRLTPEAAAPSLRSEVTSDAVARSPRPRARTAAFEAAHADPSQPRSPAPPPSAASTAGNAEITARRGEARGQENAVAASSGAAGRAQTTGNAAASNYRGEIMRRIQRVPQPSGNFRGQALVSFSIAPGGGLASAGITRSSGSAVLDRAALRVVHSAAPFPAPPPGAQTRYSVQIAGR